MTHTLKTRQQLVQYIKSFAPPDIIVQQAKDCVRPQYSLKNNYPFQWCNTWLNESEFDGLIALIILLEKHYGLQ